MKNNKLLKKTFVGILLATVYSYSSTILASNGSASAEKNDFENLPKPDSGIQIVPISEITHGSAKLAQEIVTYDINGHPTIITVVGTQDSGFTYIVYWYDNTFYNTLKCATKDFVREKINNTIDLAKQIDIDQR